MREGGRGRTYQMHNLKVYVPSAIVLIVGFALAYQFVEPAPPSAIKMATGRDDGAYHAYGQHYAKALAEHGIDLDLVQSAGSVENLKKLERGEVNFALVQGGSATAMDAGKFVSLGSMFLEPFWVFLRDPVSGDLADLQGKTIAIGPEGSGTRALALRWLSASGVTEQNSSFLPLAGSEAAQALAEGRVDVVIIVASIRAPSVERLLAIPGVEPMHFDLADAYAQRYRFARKIMLHRGAFDLQRKLPLDDTALLAATASIFVQPDIHPALVDILMVVSREIHKRGGIFEGSGYFPAPRHQEIALHENAVTFYNQGPSFLLRYLPFWVANFVDRTAVLLIPIFALLIPIARILPPLLDWNTRRRVYRWYDELQMVEREAESAQSQAGRLDLLSRLDSLEENIRSISVPKTNKDLVYTIRVHIDLVRAKIGNHPAIRE